MCGSTGPWHSTLMKVDKIKRYLHFYETRTQVVLRSLLSQSRQRSKAEGYSQALVWSLVCWLLVKDMHKLASCCNALQMFYCMNVHIAGCGILLPVQHQDFANLVHQMHTFISISIWHIGDWSVCTYIGLTFLYICLSVLQSIGLCAQRVVRRSRWVHACVPTCKLFM